MTLKNKSILVTGGSGSLGRYLIKELLKYPIKRVVSLSRDECLIKEAQQEISSPKVFFEMGDICDVKRVRKVLTGVDFVYHTAASKHVSLAEKFPREIVRINILGLLNLLENSKNISRFIYASSDKAIGPINCYGASKLLAEYLVRETNSYWRGSFLNIRFPNFLGSRGSVIELWKKQIAETNTIVVTEPKMTRYYITLWRAAKFFVKTSLIDKPNTSQPYYPKRGVKKFKLGDLAQAFIKVFGNKKTKIKIIGPLPGEKLYEDYLCDTRLATTAELEQDLKEIKLKQ